LEQVKKEIEERKEILLKCNELLKISEEHNKELIT
jgi:chromosome segregation ATPase